MDSFDRRILRQLQKDADRPVHEIAESVGLSPTPCARRIRRLKKDGYVRNIVALCDREALGLGVSVFIFVRTDQHSEKWLAKFAGGVAGIPEIVEFYRLSGAYDYLIKAVVPDIAAYDNVYKKLIEIAPLSDVHSNFAMEEIKSTTELPIDALLTKG